MNRYARLELSTGIYQFKQEYNDEALQFYANQYQQQLYGQSLFANGTIMPLGAAYVRETTVFREYGPLSGDTLRLGTRSRHRLAGSSRVRRQTWTPASTSGSPPTACSPSGSAGSTAGATIRTTCTSAATPSCAGYDYLEFLGPKAFFADAELRFPLIEAALTPIGVVGGLRAVGFFNFGGAGPFNRSIQVWTKDPTQAAQIIGFVPDPNSLQGASPVYGPVQDITGFRLVDSRASYGIGLETFALGFPIHFDWSWRTMFNKDWEDIVYDYQALADGDPSGSHWLRKPKFSVWIGYDF